MLTVRSTICSSPHTEVLNTCERIRFVEDHNSPGDFGSPGDQEFAVGLHLINVDGVEGRMGFYNEGHHFIMNDKGATVAKYVMRSTPKVQMEEGQEWLQPLGQGQFDKAYDFVKHTYEHMGRTRLQTEIEKRFNIEVTLEVLNEWIELIKNPK